MAFFDNCFGESRSIDDGISEFFYEVVNGGNMVVVSVSQNYGAYVFLFGFKVCSVRNYVINARRFFFRKLYADVYDDNFIFVFKERAIASDFFHTPERRKANGPFFCRCSRPYWLSYLFGRFAPPAAARPP